MSHMKLRSYAEFVGVSYKTAWRWWKRGTIQGEKLPSGTILVTEDVSKLPEREEIIVVYARVSGNREPTELGQSGRAARRLLYSQGLEGTPSGQGSGFRGE